MILIITKGEPMKNSELLLSIIENSREHMTADMIYMEAKKLQPSIAVGTVYRNLASMVEQNLIGLVSTSQGPARYDKSPISHPHARCTECGRVFDFKSDEIDRAIKQALGTNECFYQLTVNYLCEECRENNK
jgi:Fe2+ or Zn2+ uptake regulation protein